MNEPAWEMAAKFGASLDARKPGLDDASAGSVAVTATASPAMKRALRELVSRPDAIELELGDGAVLLRNTYTKTRLEITSTEIRLFDANGICNQWEGR
jgi:hypothetical protein